jgi:hypothetical protein
MSKSAHTLNILVQGKSGAPEVKQSFIAEDDEMEERDTKGDESEEDDDADLFDSVCSICDNGGDLLWYMLLPPNLCSL